MLVAEVRRCTALAAIALIVVALNWTYGRLPAEPKPTRLVRHASPG